MVCPLAPLPDELFITAAEVITTQRWLTIISVLESPHISFGLARLLSRWRVDANDKITSDTYRSALSPCALIFEPSELARLPSFLHDRIAGKA